MSELPRKKSEKRQLTSTRTMRCTDAEAEQIQRRAENCGMSVSEYLRKSALFSILSPTRITVLDGNAIAESVRVNRLRYRDLS